MQLTLMEFFDLVDKQNWRIELQDIVKSSRFDPWDIDVRELLAKYSEKIQEEEINKRITALLICSIILKHKIRRIGLKELEKIIEADLNENEINIDSEEDLQQSLLESIVENSEINENQIPLDVFSDKLNQILNSEAQKVKGKKPTKKQIFEIIRQEDFSITIKELYKYLQNLTVKKTDYLTLKNKLNLNNNLFLTLLFLHNEDKIKLTQKKPYDNFEIKM
jgi:chromatin segregation and condensation protein Rec8/ScpA/Scc1 (kleisin family)